MTCKCQWNSNKKERRDGDTEIQRQQKPKYGDTDTEEKFVPRDQEATQRAREATQTRERREPGGELGKHGSVKRQKD